MKPQSSSGEGALCRLFGHGDFAAECLDPALEPLRLNVGIVTALEGLGNGVFTPLPARSSTASSATPRHLNQADRRQWNLNYDGSYGDGCYQIHSAWSGPVLADPPC